MARISLASPYRPSPLASGSPWLALALRATDLCQRRHTTRCGYLLRPMLPLARSSQGVSFASEVGARHGVQGEPATGFCGMDLLGDVPFSAS